MAVINLDDEGKARSLIEVLRVTYRQRGRGKEETLRVMIGRALQWESMRRVLLLRKRIEDGPLVQLSVHLLRVRLVCLLVLKRGRVGMRGLLDVMLLIVVGLLRVADRRRVDAWIVRLLAVLVLEERQVDVARPAGASQRGYGRVVVLFEVSRGGRRVGR